jgi:hypothetical protein
LVSKPRTISNAIKQEQIQQKELSDLSPLIRFAPKKAIKCILYSVIKYPFEQFYFEAFTILIALSYVFETKLLFN